MSQKNHPIASYKEDINLAMSILKWENRIGSLFADTTYKQNKTFFILTKSAMFITYIPVTYSRKRRDIQAKKRHLSHEFLEFFFRDFMNSLAINRSLYMT